MKKKKKKKKTLKYQVFEPKTQFPVKDGNERVTASNKCQGNVCLQNKTFPYNLCNVKGINMQQSVPHDNFLAARGCPQFFSI